jgi:hypothetical protein
MNHTTGRVRRGAGVVCLKINGASFRLEISLAPWLYPVLLQLFPAKHFRFRLFHLFNVSPLY